MDLSFGEILVVVLVTIVLFGPKKIPEIARGLGQIARKVRGTMNDLQNEIMKDQANPLSDIKNEIDKVKNTLQDEPPKEKNTPQTPDGEDH